jgi:hypothetical protein
VLCYDPEVGNRNLEKDDAIVLSSRATETHEVFEKFHRHCSLAPTRCLINQFLLRCSSPRHERDPRFIVEDIC